MLHGGILTNLGGEYISADFRTRRVSNGITLNGQVSFLKDLSSFKLEVGSVFRNIETQIL